MEAGIGELAEQIKKVAEELIDLEKASPDQESEFILEKTYDWHDYTWFCNLKERDPEPDKKPKKLSLPRTAFVQVKKVSKYTLGYRVLGRAFPTLGLVQIANGLYGEEYDEVKLHEMLHIMYPEMSESEIRLKTKLLLPFEPKFH